MIYGYTSRKISTEIGFGEGDLKATEENAGKHSLKVGKSQMKGKEFRNNKMVENHRKI